MGGERGKKRGGGGDKDVHVMMLTQRAQIFIKFFHALFVCFHAFFFQALVELRFRVSPVGIFFLACDMCRGLAI